ncbi:MAG: helix-turn-helix domain-containing protein [Phycisphaeraceae bacterium]|nr:helix-turn-helix domain-containing protein [Phycisphaeraceae bacterium]
MIKPTAARALDTPARRPSLIHQDPSPQLAPGDRCLTVPEVARALGVRPVKIRRWLASGDLIGVNIEERGLGRPNWRIPPSNFAAFLARRSSCPATSEPRTPAPTHG